MKIGDRVEMLDSIRLGSYWGTVKTNAGGDMFWIHWDNYDGNNWVWSPTRMHRDDIINSNGVIHGS